MDRGTAESNILIGRMPAAADFPPDVVVRAGILALLAQDGPLTRAQLADLLHRRDEHVYEQLAVLHAAHRVILIGRRRRARWALPGTVLPTRPAMQPHHVSRAPCATESWWTPLRDARGVLRSRTGAGALDGLGSVTHRTTMRRLRSRNERRNGSEV